MLFKTSAVLALAVAPFAYAQNNGIQLQSIIAQFKNAGLTPELVLLFSSSTYAYVIF